MVNELQACTTKYTIHVCLPRPTRARCSGVKQSHAHTTPLHRALRVRARGTGALVVSMSSVVPFQPTAVWAPCARLESWPAGGRWREKRGGLPVALELVVPVQWRPRCRRLPPVRPVRHLSLKFAPNPHPRLSLRLAPSCLLRRCPPHRLRLLRVLRVLDVRPLPPRPPATLSTGAFALSHRTPNAHTLARRRKPDRSRLRLA